jgi:hypothetical protein
MSVKNKDKKKGCVFIFISIVFYLHRYNMQKVTYVLLQRHANSYWQTERDDDTSTGKKKAIIEYTMCLLM